MRLVYCWVIVANDAHAKNHALMHLPGAHCRLAHDFGLDPEWAAEQVQRIATDTPAHLLAEIDSLPAHSRATGLASHLLTAITQRCADINA